MAVVLPLQFQCQQKSKQMQPLQQTSSSSAHSWASIRITYAVINTSFEELQRNPNLKTINVQLGLSKRKQSGTTEEKQNSRNTIKEEVSSLFVCNNDRQWRCLHHRPWKVGLTTTMIVKDHFHMHAGFTCGFWIYFSINFE